MRYTTFWAQLVGFALSLTICSCQLESSHSGAINSKVLAPADAYLFRIQTNCGWGYIDHSGRLVLPPEYSSAKPFSEGLAAVKLAGRWFLIDSQGKKVILQCDGYVSRVDYYSEGFILAQTSSGCAFFDKQGRKAFGLSFQDASSFSSGLAAVKVEGKWGYINQEGESVIVPQFDQADPFSGDVVHVSLGGKWGIIDKLGRFTLKPTFTWLRDHSSGISVALQRSEAGTAKGIFVDIHGVPVFDCEFEGASGFSEGVAMVLVDGKAGFVDRTGKLVIKPAFESAGSFSEGLAAVKVGGKWGYIDHEGQLMIDPKFDEARPFCKGLAEVGVDFEYGYIDKAGKYVWEPGKEYAE